LSGVTKKSGFSGKSGGGGFYKSHSASSSFFTKKVVMFKGEKLRIFCGKKSPFFGEKRNFVKKTSETKNFLFREWTKLASFFLCSANNRLSITSW
jgi:hypothetical protein